jgi:hypothetical protein
MLGAHVGGLGMKNALAVYCASQIQLLTRLHACDRWARRD